MIETRYRKRLRQSASPSISSFSLPPPQSPPPNNTLVTFSNADFIVPSPTRSPSTRDTLTNGIKEEKKQESHTPKVPRVISKIEDSKKPKPGVGVSLLKKFAPFKNNKGKKNIKHVKEDVNNKIEVPIFLFLDKNPSPPHRRRRQEIKWHDESETDGEDEDDEDEDDYEEYNDYETLTSSSGTMTSTSESDASSESDIVSSRKELKKKMDTTNKDVMFLRQDFIPKIKNEKKVGDDIILWDYMEKNGKEKKKKKNKDNSDTDADADADAEDEDEDDEWVDYLIEKELKRDNYDKYMDFMDKITDGEQERRYFMKQTVEKQQSILKNVRTIVKHSVVKIPYSVQIVESNTIPDKYKYLVLSKIKTMETMEMERNGEYFKLKQWVDLFMKIPFGIANTLPCTLAKDTPQVCADFLKKSQETLDKAVYGMKEAKSQFMQMLAQWVANPSSFGNAIALYGPPGIGKTSLVKDGISKILNRPFAFIPLGGSTDVSYFTGHSYTFEGSIPGRIATILMESKSMTPVFYFDELDKISSTSEHGQDVIGMLMHLIDGSQNDSFHDRYFSGIDFDLRQAMFIFSYNDDTKVHPILKDRMYRIECSGYSRSDKIKIAEDFLIPSIEKNIPLKTTDHPDRKLVIECLGYIIDTYTDSEKGVRNLKRCLETIYKKINLECILRNGGSDDDNDDNGSDVIRITVQNVGKYLQLKQEDQFLSFYT